MVGLKTSVREVQSRLCHSAVTDDQQQSAAHRLEDLRKGRQFYMPAQVRGLLQRTIRSSKAGFAWNEEEELRLFSATSEKKTKPREQARARSVAVWANE